jgi:hypothetical protein
LTAVTAAIRIQKFAMLLQQVRTSRTGRRRLTQGGFLMIRRLRRGPVAALGCGALITPVNLITPGSGNTFSASFAPPAA